MRASPDETPDDLLARAHDVARALVDCRAIEIGAGRIAFARSGIGVIG